MRTTHFRPVVLALLTVAGGLARAEPGHRELSAALAAFESGLVAIASTGAPAEQSEAIVALARCRSPRFAEARDALAGSRDETVRLRLVHGLGVMEDRSLAARRLLVDSVRTGDRGLVLSAAGVLRHLGIRLHFGDVWQPAATREAWNAYVDSRFIEIIDGVGRARPWAQAGWDGLQPAVRVSLLARAGTGEALSRMLTLIERHPDLPLYSLPVAERSDPARLGELLDHDLPYVRRFASRSLARAGSTAHRDELLAFMNRLDGLTRVEAGLRLEGLAEEEVAATLDTDVLRRLSSLVGGRWLHLANRALRERGDPLRFADLKGQFDVPSTPEARVDASAAAALVRDRRRLYSPLVDALISERRYEDLPPLLEQALRFPEDWRLTTLEGALARDSGFLADLPATVAAACSAMLRNSSSISSTRGKDHAKRRAALGLLGLLARGRDADNVWEAFTSSERPLADDGVLYPVVRGFSRQAAELRSILSRHKHRSWLRFDRGLAQRLAMLPPRLVPNPERETCPGEWDPLELALRQPRTLRLKQELSRAFEAIFPDLDRLAFARAFLELRGPGPFDVEPDAPTPESLPGPGMTDEERRWLRGVLAETRAAHFRQLIEWTTRADTLIVCGGPPKTESLVPELRGTFVSSALEYLPELRDLLDDPTRAHRHAAAWALWQRVQDPQAVRTLLRDAGAGDPGVRSSALDVLRRIRYTPAAARYSALLEASEPELRQVGLWGVRDFDRLPPLQRLLELTHDANPSVAETAIEVIGASGTTAGRDALLEMLAEEPRRAWKAAGALTGYRADADIDTFLGRLDQLPRDGSSVERTYLFHLARSAIGEIASPPPWRRGVRFDPSERQVREWRKWWRNDRDKPPTERLKSRVDRLVADLIGATDERRRRGAARTLRFLFPHTPALNRLELNRLDAASASARAVQDWWQENRKLPLIDLLAPHRSGAWPLLFALEPEDTLRRAVAELHDSVRSTPGSGESAIHRVLVERAGVDFGDPALASCELRGRVLAAWSAWAAGQEPQDAPARPTCAGSSCSEHR